MTARSYEVRAADGAAIQKILQGNAVAGVDITPVAQLANAAGEVIEPATLAGQRDASAALGAPGDMAWNGVGDASIVAALKALWRQMGRASPLAGGLAPKGVRQLSVLSAGDLAALMGGPIPAGASFVSIQAERGDVRLRDDGGAPSGQAGMLVRQDSVWCCAGDLSALRLAATGASPATVNLAFYG